MAPNDIDPNQLMYLSHYPSPEAEPEAKPELGQPQKKKRKAWGQPVPEINPILPPRKRAKTAEEKEQRKNERILRNRRAADKSRQRQKAAVAELEVTKTQMEEENATLRAVLEQYRSRFGDIEGFTFSAPTPSSTAPSMRIKSEPDTYSSSTPMSYHSDFDTSSMAGSPSIAPDSPMVVADKVSPPLAPTLFAPNDQQVPNFEHHELMTSSAFGTDVSGLTQYPAAVLCDLQCQPETLVTNAPIVPVNQEFNLFIQTLFKLNLMMNYDMFSTSILLPLYQIFQILAGHSSMISILQDFSNFLDSHFRLLHSLISTPTSTTTSQPGIFRTKLLSRLLACSPKMARLLLAATDRELQRVVGEEAWAEDPESVAFWASLMTMKFAIVRLEREHRRYRHVIRDEVDDETHFEGVDYEAVARSFGRWDFKTDGHGDSRTEMYEYNACMGEVEVH